MSDWKKVLEGVAPVLATAMGGPFAGVATKFIANHFLGDGNATVEDVSQAVLGANADQLATLKQIDNDFKYKMKELEVDLSRLAVEDRKSARQAGDNVNHKPQMYLTGLTVLGFFLLLYFMLSGQILINDTLEKFLYMLIGSLLTFVSMIYRYWFGGSQTDERNMEKIYNSVPK